MSLWIVVWTPVYWLEYGPANFLWLCDLANFLILAGLWLGSPLLLSSQAVSVLLVQTAWALDFFGRLLFGFHPLGATAYMFTPSIPLGTRLLSLFHLAVPPLLLWLLWRLGYDRRGWKLQTAITWIVLPICFFFTDPERNLNWLWRPFEREQIWLQPVAFLFVMMLVYPLLIYLPTHAALVLWARRARCLRGTHEAG